MNAYLFWKKSSFNVRFDLMLRWNKANKNVLIKKNKIQRFKKKSLIIWNVFEKINFSGILSHSKKTSLAMQECETDN